MAQISLIFNRTRLNWLLLTGLIDFRDILKKSKRSFENIVITIQILKIKVIDKNVKIFFSSLNNSSVQL